MALVVAASAARPAAAQNHPWCANFADGAGINCGFASEKQCAVTIAGSGGYCSQNNLYHPAGAAPVSARPPAKHRAASRDVKN